MDLRKWQSECLRHAINKYQSGGKHFLCLATPGAGKTIMAAEVAAKLFALDLIDFVICFSPSVVIAKDIRTTLEERLGQRFDGLIGAKGGSFTYQGMMYLSDDIWRLFLSHRVLAIFDEIHHCAGAELDQANAWGEKIIQNIQHKATFSLALTGTPWRSDKTPIALSEYTKSDGKIVCDYIYGLSKAIPDNVCRTPRIVITDNNNVTLKHYDGSIDKYESFTALLEASACPYQHIVENKSVIHHMLRQASKKLSKLRCKNPNAGGLVVASSVKHAQQILAIIQSELKESAVIATYREQDPETIIENFKNNSTRWIVSVGMISEGTNIPRLQVCCHLTRIKTELHFRQILGRILRVNRPEPQEGYLFMPAESNLITYAERAAEDIPDENAVISFETSPASITVDELESNSALDKEHIPTKNFLQVPTLTIDASPDHNKPTEENSLSKAYEASLNVFGKFSQNMLCLNFSAFD
ncbi:MAG: DEAD/DEAH box helicase family protein [Hahellaceae bacterium]|nr:DEAD/DEAH box helicase family protein [Hahellaceae bacterium]